MNRDKQIEEMAKEIGNFDCFDCDNCKCVVIKSENVDCIDYALAEHLIVFRGYRKASEVAREIFAEIETSLHYKLINGEIHLIIREEDYNHYKKKYTEENNNDSRTN